MTGQAENELRSLLRSILTIFSNLVDAPRVRSDSRCYHLGERTIGSSAQVNVYDWDQLVWQQHSSRLQLYLFGASHSTSRLLVRMLASPHWDRQGAAACCLAWRWAEANMHAGLSAKYSYTPWKRIFETFADLRSGRERSTKLKATVMNSLRESTAETAHQQSLSSRT